MKRRQTCCAWQGWGWGEREREGAHSSERAARATHARTHPPHPPDPPLTPEDGQQLGGHWRLLVLVAVLGQRHAAAGQPGRLLSLELEGSAAALLGA